MRVTQLQIDGFGVWTALRLGELSDQVTVFYGVNEAGKTTLMQFMRTVFYGFSPQRRARYLPPVHGGDVGGTMHVEHNRQRLCIDRHLARYGDTDEAERVEVRAPDGAALPSGVLEQLLSGVDEPTFNNVFAVGLRELQELGTLDDTDAAELLYKLTTGLDRVSLVDVMQKLERAGRALLDEAGAVGAIRDLQDRRDQLRRRVEELSSTGHDWLALQQRRRELAERADQLQQQLGNLHETSQIVQAAIECQGLWGRRAALLRQLELLAPAGEVEPESLTRLERWGAAMQEQRRKIELLKRRRREIRQESALLPINRRLWEQAARIEAMSELAPWIVTLQTHVDQLRGEVQGLEARLAHSSTPLGIQEEVVTEQLPEISRRTIAMLRGPARAVRDETQRLKQAEEELEAARQHCDEVVEQLETALLDQGQEDLAKAVEQRGGDVSRLRRRLQLEQRVDEMSRQREQLRGEHRDLLEEQVLPLKTLAWLGVPFVVGVMLVMGGIVWSSAATLGWPVAVLGLAGWGVAVVAKISMERTAARDLEQCERQMEMLKDQLEQTGREIEQLGEPSGDVEHLERKMKQSEEELASLQELLPLEAGAHTARQRLQTAQRRFDQLTELAQEARGRWRTALRRAQLPETLSPQAVRQLAEGNEHLLQARRQLELKRQELASRQQELESLGQRIAAIAEQVELQYSLSDPQQLLNHLSVAVSEQRALQERRRKLRQEDRKLQRDGRKVVAQLRELRTHRRALLTRCGVDSEQQLREIAARAAQRRALEEEREEIEQQIQLALGNRFEFAAVERELIDHDREQLLRRHAELLERIEGRQAELADVHQQQGAVQHEAESLVDERACSEAKLELGCVEQKLQEAARRWRVLAVTAQLLETVRIIYETHRQPQTLIDASRFFQELTEGQYTRIWTPLTDMSLRVDQATGESLPLDVLSCGTREAVFLSLRLALVADFARRGIFLPLVLDDVLVNFDSRRAEAAARVLCSFAQHEHQVLMFTCHDHIARLFQSLEAPVRVLPPHGCLEEPQEPDLGCLEPSCADQPPELEKESKEQEDQVMPDEHEEQEIHEEEEGEEDRLPRLPEEADAEYALAEEVPVLQRDAYALLIDQPEEDAEQEDAEQEDAEQEDAQEDAQVSDAQEQEEEEEEEEYDVPAEYEEPWEEEPWDEDQYEEWDEEEELAEEELWSDEADEEEEFEPGEVQPPPLDVVNEEGDDEQEEDEEDEDSAGRSSQQRFTWESPERWWDSTSGGGAAA